MRIGFGRYTETKFPSREGQRRMAGGPAGVWFATLVAIVIAMPAFATEPTLLDKKTVSSKAYVDTSVETRQNKIPAAGINSANAGTAVVMYTEDGDGEIGERGIYSDPTNYTAGTDANKLVTASALKGSVTSLPTKETSKLTCANPGTCSLWIIEDQQVYGGNSCKLGGENTSVESECCSGFWGLASPDGGTCGCRTNSDCKGGRRCTGFGTCGAA